MSDRSKMYLTKAVQRVRSAFYRGGAPVGVNIPGMRPFSFALHTKTDLHISGPIRSDAILDPLIVELLRAAVRPDDVLIDAGANIGWFSVIGSDLVGRRGRVIAFEPDPDNLKLLRRNLGLNACENVLVIGEALGSVAKGGTLYRSADNQGDHQMSVVGDRSEQVAVKVNTIDNVLTHSGGRVDFVKIDTQGSEAAILAGMGETAAKNPQMKVVLEFWPRGLERCGSSVAELSGILAEFQRELWVLDLHGTAEPMAVGDLPAIAERYVTPYGNHAELVMIPPGDPIMTAALRARLA